MTNQIYESDEDLEIDAELPVHHLRMKYFKKQHSSEGDYIFYRFCFHNYVKNELYVIKVNKKMIFSFFKDFLNEEEEDVL